jgi:formylglycine-generating enzyme required for sulfatase activity
MHAFMRVPAGNYEVKPSAWWVERCEEIPEYAHFQASNAPKTISLPRELYVARFPVTNLEFEAVMPGHQRSRYSTGDNRCHILRSCALL